MYPLHTFAGQTWERPNYSRQATFRTMAGGKNPNKKGKNNGGVSNPKKGKSQAKQTGSAPSGNTGGGKTIVNSNYDSEQIQAVNDLFAYENAIQGLFDHSMQLDGALKGVEKGTSEYAKIVNNSSASDDVDTLLYEEVFDKLVNAFNIIPDVYESMTDASTLMVKEGKTSTRPNGYYNKGELKGIYDSLKDKYMEYIYYIIKLRTQSVADDSQDALWTPKGFAQFSTLVQSGIATQEGYDDVLSVLAKKRKGGSGVELDDDFVFDQMEELEDVEELIEGDEDLFADDNPFAVEDPFAGSDNKPSDNQQVANDNPFSFGEGQEVENEGALNDIFGFGEGQEKDIPPLPSDSDSELDDFDDEGDIWGFDEVTLDPIEVQKKEQAKQKITTAALARFQGRSTRDLDENEKGASDVLYYLMYGPNKMPSGTGFTFDGEHYVVP